MTFLADLDPDKGCPCTGSILAYTIEPKGIVNMCSDGLSFSVNENGVSMPVLELTTSERTKTFKR